MSLVEGFMNLLKTYIKRGLIYSRHSIKSEDLISNFIENLFQMMNQSESCFVVMAVYFERLMQKHSSLVNENNLLRLIFASGMIAIKVQEDFSYKNSYFAQVSGISSKEINYLEIHFLDWIEYKLFVRREDYDICYYRLIKLALI